MEKENFVLTEENYHSPEARKHFLGSSMFKEFEKCEVMGLAKVNGEVPEKTSVALLFGSYVDAYFSGELNMFIAQHPEMFTQKGTLRSEYKDVETVIKTFEEDEYLSKYLSGEKQKIMTGFIEGVPFKIKIDSYHPGKAIVDQKVMKDFEPVWVEQDGRNVLLDFVSAYGYDVQGSIYQAIERQNSADHKPLPFILDAVTKEEVPDKLLTRIDQEYLDEALERVKAKAPRYWRIIQGLEKPVGCGNCPACRAKKKIEGVMPYSKLKAKVWERGKITWKKKSLLPYQSIGEL